MPMRWMRHQSLMVEALWRCHLLALQILHVEDLSWARTDHPTLVDRMSHPVGGGYLCALRTGGEAAEADQLSRL